MQVCELFIEVSNYVNYTYIYVNYTYIYALIELCIKYVVYWTK